MPRKLTIDEKLRRRNVTAPPKVLYWLLMQVIKILNRLRDNFAFGVQAALLRKT